MPAQTATPTPAAVVEKILPDNSENEINLIHFGDVIEVDVIGSVEYDWRGTLNPEGFLSGIDFVENPIYALCRSEEEIALDVAKGYGKILRDPKVTVRILDRSNRPFVLFYGAVRTPHRFQVNRPVYLNELVILSGGLTEKTNGVIQILRPKNLSCKKTARKQLSAQVGSGESRARLVSANQDNGSEYIKIKISDLLTGRKEANPQILSGDIITALESEAIYVIGGVTNPKPIPSRGQIVLSRAIAVAGGLSKNADARKITIFRRESGETKIISADLEKIKSGASEDVVLQAFDIVEVEQTGREKKKFPPVIKVAEADEKKTGNLPLRIID